ncbi:hypothetical protein FJV46_04430 [Arthrobacter agilis]|uniref:MGMT family protein n=1 Tax=Arthrobacter agilis TaxID=37921 RepID=UPI000B35D6A2|nr:MGMT family protein [Arthrobacter agilis]OUM41359.1 hypothetical protein B8W74_10615 [Arthrobacter agilis]PPB46309.1 hypothetical protein CI784_08280 [Arthrobacter agilis]TPV27066.1 hypothetical protein FJV46_04430 [Arthrobacter agilis]VDR32777.1 Predicted methylated DNA-protein cysteine methyltransferase [Arthrobacter agilis]
MLNGPGALRTCGHEGPDRAGGRARTRVDAAAFAEAVLDVTCLIPSGHVLTYGDIAELLGHGGPRQVGRALSRGSREVPWWRVLRSGGHPAVGLALRARPHYEAEGTALRVPAGAHGAEEYRVDLAAARWWPSEADHATVEALSSALEGFGP